MRGWAAEGGGPYDSIPGVPGAKGDARSGVRSARGLPGMPEVAGDGRRRECPTRVPGVKGNARPGVRSPQVLPGVPKAKENTRSGVRSPRGLPEVPGTRENARSGVRSARGLPEVPGTRENARPGVRSARGLPGMPEVAGDGRRRECPTRCKLCAEAREEEKVHASKQRCPPRPFNRSRRLPQAPIAFFLSFGPCTARFLFFFGTKKERGPRAACRVGRGGRNGA